MQSFIPRDIASCDQPKVLAVEDDEDNLLYISSALALFNYHCIVAKNATDGLSLAQKYLPDLILLDIVMPYMSGMELIKKLKSNSVTYHIPVIAVTALADEKKKKIILDAGFTDCLVKPYLLDDLEQIICSHILNTALC